MKVNRNNLMDKITYLIRDKIIDEIKFEDEKDIMIEKIKKICNEILEKEDL